MALVDQSPAETYLKDRHIHFELAPHAGAYTARSEARALGLPSDTVLKAVVLRIGDDFAIGVVPASRRLDIPLVARIARDARVRLATEDEIMSRFPGSELGALPPIPGVLGVQAFVDPTVFEPDEVAFADGRQSESIIASPREMFWGENASVARITQKADMSGPWGFDGEGVDFG